MNEGLRVEEAGFGALGHETSRFGIEDSERVCVCVCFCVADFRFRVYVQEELHSSSNKYYGICYANAE